MSNPSKRRGTDAEVKLLAWMRDHGHPETVRNPPAGTKDVGDLHAFAECGCDLVIEVKNHANIATALRDGVAELEVEKANAGAEHAVLVVKRRGVSDPGRWYAVREVRDDPEIGAS